MIVVAWRSAFKRVYKVDHMLSRMTIFGSRRKETILRNTGVQEGYTSSMNLLRAKWTHRERKDIKCTDDNWQAYQTRRASHTSTVKFPLKKNGRGGGFHILNYMAECMLIL